MRKDNIKSLRKLKNRTDIFPLFFYEHYKQCPNNIYPASFLPLKKRIIPLSPYDIINQYLAWSQSHKGYDFWYDTAKNI